jgi:hypothetical protein
MSKEPDLVVDPVPAFHAVLSPAAADLFRNPVKTIYAPDAHHLVTFNKTAAWPIKEWYQECAGKFFNRLVADGVVKGVLGAYGVELLAAGRALAYDGVGGRGGGFPTGHKELGPDRYGIIAVPFTCPLSVEEMNRKYNTGCFALEGQITSNYPLSMHLTQPPPTFSEAVTIADLKLNTDEPEEE